MVMNGTLGTGYIFCFLSLRKSNVAVEPIEFVQIALLILAIFVFDLSSLTFSLCRLFWRMVNTKNNKQ